MIRTANLITELVKHKKNKDPQWWANTKIDELGLPIISGKIDSESEYLILELFNNFTHDKQDISNKIRKNNDQIRLYQISRELYDSNDSIIQKYALMIIWLVYRIDLKCQANENSKKDQLKNT